MVFMQPCFLNHCKNSSLTKRTHDSSSLCTHTYKCSEKSQAVGSHIHLSISRTEKEDAFLAGLLEKWSALAAFYAPNYDSYTRVREDEWICWSLGNRTTAIRKIKTAHWVSSTTTPYSLLYISIEFKNLFWNFRIDVNALII